MAVKECGSNESKSPRLLNFIRRNIIWLIILITVTIIGCVLAWILHTPKPRFILQDATVFSFNVSGDPPNLLTSSIQTTLISRNTNGKTGIYYDRLDVYASYQNQQITLPTSIPVTYQGHEEVNVWSPFVGGRYVPIARTNALSLIQEQSRGAVKVLVHVDGKIRWKVGPFTRTSRLFVRCPAFISFGNSAAGVVVWGRGVKYTLVTVCSVSV
ncbi:hypothetical protein Bca4012_016150 [Brassica carinata]